MIDFDGGRGIEIIGESSNSNRVITPFGVEYTIAESDTKPTASYQVSDYTPLDNTLTEEINISDDRVIIDSGINLDGFGTFELTTEYDEREDVIKTFEDYIGIDITTPIHNIEEPADTSNETVKGYESTPVANEMALFEECVSANDIGNTSLVDERYILSTIANDIYIIDIRRAMSRIMYDRYSSVIASGNSGGSHKMIFPVTISLQPSDMLLLEDSKSDLEAMGFSLSINSTDSSVDILGVPIDIGSADPFQMFEEIVETLRGDDSPQYSAQRREWLIRSVSRVASSQRFDSVARGDLKHIVEQLINSSNYSYTPSGKSIIIKIGVEDIKRLLN